MPDEEPKKPPVAKLISRKRDDDEYEVVDDPKVEEDEDDDRPRRKRRRRRDDDEEEGDATGGLIPYKNAKALLAYYIGIFGFFVPLIGSIAAIVLGFQGLKYAKEHPKARGQAHAIIGIICGIMGSGFYLLILVGIVVALVSKK